MRLEGFRKIGQFIKDVLGESTETLIQRRNLVQALPINPNGTFFIDPETAGIYEDRLTRQGYLFKKRCSEGKQWIRPISQAEFDEMQQLNNRQAPKEESSAILDRYWQLADQNSLTDLPLYRDPKIIDPERV